MKPAVASSDLNSCELRVCFKDTGNEKVHYCPTTTEVIMLTGTVTLPPEAEK